MHGEMKERLESLTAPYGRQVRLDDVRFESGMRLFRVTTARESGLPFSMSIR
jgi:hypothetical protein